MNCPHGVGPDDFACPLCEQEREEGLVAMRALPVRQVHDLGMAISRVVDMAVCEHEAPRSGWCPDCGAIRDDGIWVCPIVMSRVLDLDAALRTAGALPMAVRGDSDAKNVIRMKPRS